MKALSKSAQLVNHMLDDLSQCDNILVIIPVVLASIVRLVVPFTGSPGRYG